MGYRQITSVEVFNFMVYKHAVINFDDSNIINLKGYNSGGKSTMLKAIAVCLMNMYPASQSKFIRHGEKYFRIIVKFKGGYSIVRDKYISGQSLYEVYRDDKCIFTTKEGGKLTKVSSVPQKIQDFLGLCLVSTGCLNYQVRQDPLWLIETTGSENYNSLNEILKTEEISRANALLNSDKNALNSDITGIEASLQDTKMSLNEISGYTNELLDALEKKEFDCRDLSERYRSLKSSQDVIDSMSSMKNIPNIPVVDSNRYENIDSIYNTAKDVAGLRVFPDVAKCDISRYRMVNSLYSEVTELGKLDEQVAPNIDQISTDKLICIFNMVTLLRQISVLTGGIEKLRKENIEVEKKLDTIVKKAREDNIRYIKCDNCGTYVKVPAEEK